MGFCLNAVLWVAYTYVVVVYTRIATLQLCTSSIVAPDPQATTQAAVTAMRRMAEQAETCDGPRWAMWHTLDHDDRSRRVTRDRDDKAPFVHNQQKWAQPEVPQALRTADDAARRGVQAVFAGTRRHFCHVVEVNVDGCGEAADELVWHMQGCKVTKVRLDKTDVSLLFHEPAINETDLLMFVGCHEGRMLDVLRNVPFDELHNLRACLVRDFPHLRGLMIRNGLCEADRAAEWTMWISDFELKRVLCAWRDLRHPP